MDAFARAACKFVGFVLVSFAVVSAVPTLRQHQQFLRERAAALRFVSAFGTGAGQADGSLSISQTAILIATVYSPYLLMLAVGTIVYYLPNLAPAKSSSASDTLDAIRRDVAELRKISYSMTDALEKVRTFLDEEVRTFLDEKAHTFPDAANLEGVSESLRLIQDDLDYLCDKAESSDKDVPPLS